MCTLGEMKLMKREREESFLLPMYYLRFGLQVLRVYLGSQFYHPNINYITQKLYPFESRNSEVYIGIFFIIYDLY